MRIPLASLTNLDNLLCDKLRDRIASFDQVELTQRVLIGFGQYRYFFRPPRKGFEYAIDRRSSFFPPAERCNKSQTAQMFRKDAELLRRNMLMSFLGSGTRIVLPEFRSLDHHLLILLTTCSLVPLHSEAVSANHAIRWQAALCTLQPRAPLFEQTACQSRSSLPHKPEDCEGAGGRGNGNQKRKPHELKPFPV